MTSIRFGLVGLAMSVFSAAPAAGQVYIPPSSADFSSFANGDLAGQNGWVPVSTTPTGVQINGGRAVVQAAASAPPGVRYPFAASVPATAGTSYYVGLTLRVTQSDAVTQLGADILGSRTVAGPDALRLAVQTVSAGVYRFLVTGGPSSTNNYTYFFSGTASHAVGQTLRVVLAYDFRGGAQDDGYSLYVDPVSPTRAGDTAEFSVNNTAGTWADLGDLAGTSIVSPPLFGPMNCPGFEIGRITAAGDFASVYSFITPVPEPSALALAGGAAVAAVARFRRLGRRS